MQKDKKTTCGQALNTEASHTFFDAENIGQLANTIYQEGIIDAVELDTFTQKIPQNLIEVSTPPIPSPFGEPIDPFGVTFNGFSQNDFTELSNKLSTPTSQMADASFYFAKEATQAFQPNFYFQHSPPSTFTSTRTTENLTADFSAFRIFNPVYVRRDFPVLQQKVNGQPLVWLDNGATTQKPQSVIDALSNFYTNYNSNIHRGVHSLAAKATDAYENTREKIRQLIGAASTKEIVYVRGTTEGLNLIANTFGCQRIHHGDEILISQLEHHANIVPWQLLAKRKGAKIRMIPIDKNGDILLESYERLFNQKTKLVAIGQVSNAIGTVLPVKTMIETAHRYGVPVVVDGAQSVQHMAVNVQELDADFFVFSGHKIFAPMGIGAVYGKQQHLEKMPPWQGGGNMIDQVTFEATTYNSVPALFEAGTPSVGDAVGLGAAIDYVQQIGMEKISTVTKPS